MNTYQVTPKALRPLMRAFWSSNGWQRPPDLPSGVALDAAIADGVMFAEARTLDHDGWVASVREAAKRTSPVDVADAFLTSLTTRRLDLRSALGSYAVARHLPVHAFISRDGRLCSVCKLYNRPLIQDLNVLNFERFKWGGVRRDDLPYVAFDLEQLQRAPRDPLTDEAVALGRAALDAPRQAPAGESATAAEVRLRMIKSSREERLTVMDILGVCGVTATAERPGYQDAFVPYSARDLPPRHFVDRSYPVCWWSGGDGINDRAVKTFLPQLAR